MAAVDGVIPLRMIRELDRLRAAAGLVGLNPERERPDSRFSKSIDLVLNASELIRAKSVDVARLEREITDLWLANAHLILRYNEAQAGLGELKDQLQTQTARAEAAENANQRLENQLHASEKEMRKMERNVSRLTESIEQTLSGNAPPESGRGRMSA